MATSMTMLIPALGATVAIGAAARSTWSPCGSSMLSTITRFGERSRGHRYGATASWFIAGSTLGGATLGALAAVLAMVVSAVGAGDHPGEVAIVAAAAAGLAAATDAGAFGAVIPIWRRQVDDRWLVRYRSWVYAGGFGWQIGVGLATYIMTAAVFLVVVLAALSANPLVAAGICTLFGLTRGVAVLLTAKAHSPAQLRVLYRRFDQAGPAVRWAVVGLQAAVMSAVVVAQWPGARSAIDVAAVVLAVAAAGLAVAVAVLVSRSDRVPPGEQQLAHAGGRTGGSASVGGTVGVGLTGRPGRAGTGRVRRAWAR
jgi:hypothetical protein